MANNEQKSSRNFPAKIIEIVDEYTVVFNRGSQDGIKSDQEFLVFSLSDKPLTDPETGEELERLEQVKGEGKVIHVQKKISTLQSIRRASETNERVVQRGNPLGGTVFGEEKYEIRPEQDIMPFDNPETGDRVKPK